jgi:preprotein translocase subunit YajC
MDLWINVAQAFIAIAMFDVWLFRYNRPQRARGGDAQTMAEEFRVYGLPDWFRNLIRVLKLSAGTLMVVGIWSAQAALVAGIMLVIMMGGAIVMHIKVRDPLLKSVPATTFFVLSGLVAYAHWPA